MTATRMDDTTNGEYLDVLIVGAGISGIGTAWWLQEKCPGKRYLILEGRDAIGGTWDLFRYPGVRSDSDMFTFGYRFRPWNNPQALSSGASIRSYLHDTVRAGGIDRHIRFGHRVLAADWSDEDRCWTVTASHDGATVKLRARFLMMCSGYYHYEQAHRPEFAGEESFRGRILQPQFWPEDLDYQGKRVVIVGSGATAVTLVPAMAPTAAHVTMLQRSPTYILSLPNKDSFYRRLSKLLPDRIAYRITRWKNIAASTTLFTLAKRFPGFIRNFIINSARKQLPEGFDVDRHFNPGYNPWDQRLCFVPGGDFYKAIRQGKASVATDTIARFTEDGLLLHSGEKLEADLVVLATGLHIRLLGGATISVNGKEVHPNDVMVYKGMMISNVPNMALAFGYTNASWTLKTDLTANYLCKLLRYMDRNGFDVVTPRGEVSDSAEPFLNLNSGYIQRATGNLPKQGARKPWRVRQSYLHDMITMRFGKINDGVLHFQKRKTIS